MDSFEVVLFVVILVLLSVIPAQAGIHPSIINQDALSLSNGQAKKNLSQLL